MTSPARLNHLFVTFREGMDRLIALDRVTFLWVIGHRAPPLDPLFVALSYAGGGGLIWLAIAMAAVIWRRMSAEGGLVLAISLLVASLMTNQLLKPAVGRTRPFMIPPQVELIGDRPDDPSFPSGHSTNAFAGAYVLAALVPAARAFWWG